MLRDSGRPTSTEAEAHRVSSRLGLTGTNTEWAIVLVMVAAAMLSAVAFWQATLFAEESASRHHQARFAEGQRAQLDSAVEAKIANDRQVLLRCQTAIERRDAALERFAAVFEEPSVAVFAEAEQTHLALEPLLIANGGDCTFYDVRSALEWAAFLNSGQVGFGDPQQLRGEADRYSEAERLAVLAAVAFAAVLLALTLADASYGGPHPQWVRRWLITGWLLAAIGMVLAVAAFVTASRFPVDVVALVVGLILLTAAATAGPSLARRFTPVRRSLGRLGRMRRAARLRMRSAGLGSGARTQAEIFGAVTLVVFALAVLGYSDSSSRERDSLASADGLASQARQALEIGQRSGLTTLSFVSQLSELDAREVAGGQGPEQADVDEASPNQRAREAVLKDMWPQEQLAWEELLKAHRDGARSCLDDELILAWARPERSDGSAGATLPATLLQEYRDDQTVLYSLIDRATAGATLCSTQAAVEWQAAEGWGRRASLFTIALVALGLAGFLFAQAADADRSKSPRRWLFVSGVVGMTAGITVAAWALAAVPDTPDGEDLRVGTRAYVDSQMAHLDSDCEAAASAAEVAVERLDGFAPAHVALADAAYCDESQGSVIAASRTEDRVDAFIRHLEQARRLGLERGSIEGNLGWAYVLRAIGDGSGDASPSDLEVARDFTASALARDRANPFWCFNRAFIELLGGDPDQATSFYREALASLAGEEGESGACAEVAFTDLGIQRYMRLSALADLELLDDTEEVDAVRSLVVGSEVGADFTCNVDVATDEEIEVFPGELWLPRAEVEEAVEPYSAIWYFRPTADADWTVLLQPSLSMIAPGCHVGLTTTGELRLPGQYRADVYLDGQLTERLTTEYEWYADRGLDESDFRRVYVPDLGIGVVIPRSWEVESSRPGVEIAYRGPGGGLVLRRAEGVSSEGLRDAVLVWGNQWLEHWRSTSLTAEDLGQVDGEWGEENLEWYLDLPRSHSVQPIEGLIVGIGHQQYLSLPDTGPLSSRVDATDDSCPGTTLMTLVDVEDPGLADTIWRSQYLSVSPHSVSAGDIEHVGQFAGPQFSISIPDGWNAIGCPGWLSAVSPDSLSNVLISSTPYARGLDAFTAETIADYQNPDNGFTGWRLESQTRRVTTDGTRADELVFTWTSDDILVRQTQLFSVINGRAHYMTVTTYADDSELFAEEREVLLSSFGLVDVPRIVTAACEGCAAQEWADRQANVDQVARLLDVVDDRHCSDSSDDAQDGVLARISCGWPGGVRADFSLWPTGDAYLDHVAQFERIEGGLLQEWRLRADDPERIGITVEWIDGDDARFFWTYDTELITADAALAGADQDRLNSWWSTSGALVRE